MSRNDRREPKWAAFVGDFSILKDFLAEKNAPHWTVLQFVDSLLRGFGQVVFSNNPISGLLIAIALGTGSPGTLAFCSATSFLGLIISMVAGCKTMDTAMRNAVPVANNKRTFHRIYWNVCVMNGMQLLRDTSENVENGHTVFNPLLVGAVSYALIPKTYGAFDAFSLLLVLLGTIFSVYLARSLGSGKFPSTVWPFNLTELALLLALSTQTTFPADETSVRADISLMDNATSDATTDDASFIAENVTSVGIDWGMVLRGIVASSSQVFAVNNVATGAVIYLAVLIYSPITAGFAFVGALIGTFTGLELGASMEEVSSGAWGFNSLLTAASLGGTFFVLNGQTAAATLVATVYTGIVQYAVLTLFQKIGLPILTVPFILVTSLFLRLQASPDGIFPRPAVPSFPDKQRRDYTAKRRSLLHRNSDVEDPEFCEKKISEPTSD